MMQETLGKGNSNIFEKESELGIEDRDDLATIFGKWLDYSRSQKEKWKKMIRFRYLLGRMKMARMMLAWKVGVRKKKVQRLQYTIASHAHYKRVLKEALLGLREQCLL